MDFLRELRRKLGNQKLLIATVNADPNLVNTTYNVTGMMRYIDSVNIMAFDFNRNFQLGTRLRAPIYQNSNEPNDCLNVNCTITKWIAYGAAANKIILGVAKYADTFTLAAGGNGGIQSPTTGPGTAGPYSNRLGFLTDYEDCNYKFTKRGYTHCQNDSIPFGSYDDNQWASSENCITLTEKCVYAIETHLAGIGVYSVAYIDYIPNLGYEGYCGDTFKEIISVIVKATPELVQHYRQAIPRSSFVCDLNKQ